MVDYEELIDIRSVKQRKNSSRVDNAFFFIEQIKNHTLFKVERDVVEIKFSGVPKTLSSALVSYIHQKIRE